MRQQLKRVDVARLDQAEVAMVERGDLRLVEPLGDGHNRGVDEADVGVGVFGADLADAGVVPGSELFDQERSLGDGRKECQVDRSMEPGTNEVVYFDGDCSGYDHRFGKFLEQFAASLVVVIVSIDRCIQGARVND